MTGQIMTRERIKPTLEEEPCHYCKGKALLSSARWKKLFDVGEPFLCGKCWKQRKYLGRLADTGLFDTLVNEGIEKK